MKNHVWNLVLVQKITNSNFIKCVIAPQELFFRDTIKRCAKESSSSRSESELKSKSLKYEKSEKLTFEIWNWFKIFKLIFLNCVLASMEGIFLLVQAKDAWRRVLLVVQNRIKKKVSGVQKKWKTDVWNLRFRCHSDFTAYEFGRVSAGRRPYNR